MIFPAMLVYWRVLPWVMVPLKGYWTPRLLIRWLHSWSCIYALGTLGKQIMPLILSWRYFLCSGFKIRPQLMALRGGKNQGKFPGLADFNHHSPVLFPKLLILQQLNSASAYPKNHRHSHGSVLRCLHAWPVTPVTPMGRASM